MPDIAENIASLKNELPQGVKLVAVSKTKPVSDILVAYKSGHRIFGENRVQELLSKKDLLPSDIEWHLIGHLQTNKVKYVVPFISMIHSVDSYKLIKTINYESEKANRVVDCLLQFHIASEETKYGFSMDEVIAMISTPEFSKLDSVKICGVMGIATFTDDENLIRKEFRYLADCFRELKRRYFPENDSFREISMGMSGDYKVAIEEGTTIIRLGSIIFGGRY
ncbi:MAG TPA: YggS family pyridoxal phosphate-dependent enzyme [Bacteroidales bacterium]|jgi:pyridoxal phosphate enzyme (YggS family)|nr:YggS family pyridoxal phosphate-dependent enzyme [Bacteroidales bacterium]HQM68785.1 YggS family pyridoxal phosphate-dependent enzyme [Bacteroidales bacterium]